MFKKTISLALSIVLVTTMSFASLADVKNEKNKLSNLEKKERKLVEQKKDLKKKKKDAQEYIANVDKQIGDVAKDIYKTQGQLKKVDKKIVKTKKKLNKAKKSIKIQTRDMTKRIQYMYENGSSEILDMLLNSKGISDFLSKAEYITELSEYDRKMLNKLKETKNAIKKSKEVLETSKIQLDGLQEEQKNRQTTLKKLSASKKAELKDYSKLLKNKEADSNKITEEIAAQKSAIAAAEAAEEARQRQIAQEAARQSDAINKKNNAAYKKHGKNGGGSYNQGVSGGGWTWPCPGHTSVSSGFGTRKDPFGGGGSYMHNGIDIPAPAGTPIVAASSGTVAWSSYSTTAGNWIGISHGNGVVSVYMHMSSRIAVAGQHVNKGQTIGLVGTTGSSTGNHLHFGVQLNGSYVNPLGYV